MERKGVYVGGKKGVSVITERISSNSILKIITFKRSTTEGCVYICSVGPLSNANSSPYCIFFFARARGKQLQTKCCFVFQGGTGKSLCSSEPVGFCRRAYRSHLRRT